MPTQTQLSKLSDKVKQYSKRYLSKEYDSLDESATRIMVNNFLTAVLGYMELEEIRTEYAIKGAYADYVIELNRKKHFIVEVKAITLDLSEKHLRQAVNYAANEGVDWIILTNGKMLELYRVLFKKPIEYKKVFVCDLSSLENVKDSIEYLYYLTKPSLLKKEIEDFWARFQALEPNNLALRLYDLDILKFLRRSLKTSTGLNFTEEDILDSLYHVVVNKIVTDKPNLTKIKGKLAKKKQKNIEPETSVPLVDMTQVTVQL